MGMDEKKQKDRKQDQTWFIVAILTTGGIFAYKMGDLFISNVKGRLQGNGVDDWQAFVVCANKEMQGPKDFKGGSLGIIFGKAVIHFEETEIQDGAVLRMEAYLGEAILHVPENVNVVFQGNVNPTRIVNPVENAPEQKTLFIELKYTLSLVSIQPEMLPEEESPKEDSDILEDEPVISKEQIAATEDAVEESAAAEDAKEETPSEGESATAEDPEEETPVEESATAEDPEEETPVEESTAAEDAKEETPSEGESATAEDPEEETPVEESATAEDPEEETPVEESTAAEDAKEETPSEGESATAEDPEEETPVEESVVAEDTEEKEDSGEVGIHLEDPSENLPEYVGIEKEGLPYLLEPDVGESVVKETKNVKPSCVYLGDETEPEEIKGKNLRVVLRRVDTEEMKKDHLEQDAIQEVLRELELQEQDLGDVFAYFEEDKFFPLEALSDRVLQCQID